MEEGCVAAVLRETCERNDGKAASSACNRPIRRPAAFRTTSQPALPQFPTGIELRTSDPNAWRSHPSRRPFAPGVRWHSLAAAVVAFQNASICCQRQLPRAAPPEHAPAVGARFRR